MELETQTSQNQTHKGSSVCRVYVVEDNRKTRNLIIKHLQTLDNVVVWGWASSALHALEDPKHKEVDLLMTDFNVPKMMGLELCKQVIADNPDALIPMLTAQIDIYFAKQVLKQERVCM